MKVVNIKKWLPGFAVCLLLLLPGSTGLIGSQKEKSQEQILKGAKTVTIKGTLRRWADADKTPLDRRNKPRRLRPVLNLDREVPIVKKNTLPDPVVQKSYTGNDKALKGRTTLMPSVDKSYAGLNQSAHGSGWPPDTNGDVGGTYYIQTVNTSIGIFRKSDGVLMSATAFDDFFEGGTITGTPCDSDNNGDPIVLYDQYNQRWFILDFAWDPSETDGSYFSIAASKTSDPTGDWWLYAMRADATLMNDYPKCGVWHDGIYITANMFQFTGGFTGSKVWALKTPALYSGTLTSQDVYSTNWYAWSLLPTNARGATGPPASAPCYLYTADPDEWGYSAQDTLAVFKYDVDWATPGNTSFTGPTLIGGTAAFAFRSSNIPQQDTSNTLDALGNRLMYAAQYRNFGTHESVYLCHSVDVGGTAAVRWYEVRISGGTSSIYQQGSYQPDANHRWMGSIAADKNGNIAVGYSASSSSMYPAIRYAGRLSSDTLGELSQGEETMIAGTGSQTNFDRWGDYSMMTVDPTDDETFWYTTEYYSTTGYNWQTRIGTFKFASSPVPGTDVPDFNGDGVVDLLWRNYNASKGDNVAWYMDGVTRSSINFLSHKLADNQWVIAGTGDFNNDGNPDILWRNYDSPGGWNVIWYMNGTTRTSAVSLPRVSDTHWRIEAVGDFNGDTKPDLLWRDYDSPGGSNVVWYMDGATRTSIVNLPKVTDMNWEIVGTGDFNGDTDTDIIWRNYANANGFNVVWFMDGITRSSISYLPRVSNVNWKIEAIGDFNSDDNPDIVWRDYGNQGGANVVWYMNGSSRTGLGNLPPVKDLDWRICN